MRNKYSLQFLVNRKEYVTAMLKHLNGLPYLQFKFRKWVFECGKIEWYRGIECGKIEWYRGIKSFLPLLNITLNDFKALTRFSETSFLSFIFWYIFRITGVCCLAIILKLILFRKKNVILFGPNIWIFIQKKSCSLRIAVPEFQKYKITFNFSEILEK